MLDGFGEIQISLTDFILDTSKLRRYEKYVN
jgi:hypothetical protein